jgi:hypothetical protein
MRSENTCGHIHKFVVLTILLVASASASAICEAEHTAADLAYINYVSVNVRCARGEMYDICHDNYKQAWDSASNRYFACMANLK